ncbi:MAG: Flagellar sensor histidine kinase FleS [Labilithrix sp.]|nr:Flagellar sensor histidine kinase FleS [Labilithrix sp.]
MSFTVFGAYLGRSAASRHFLYAAAAGLTASVYCVTDAVLAGHASVSTTIWAGRISMLATTLHGAMWLAFLAAWDRRRLSRVERALIVASVVGGLLSLVPGTVVTETVTVREVAWLGVTYRDPGVGPLIVPVVGLSYLEQAVATVAALRMSRRNRRATAVALGLGLFCAIIVVDSLTGLHFLDLPYLADPALALLFLSIGSVVVSDAAESAAKSAALERATVALAEREELAALGQLAAVVAHEVRNPVAIIFGALTALERTPRSDEDATLLGIVGEEADRLKQLVTRLLDAVRPFELQYSRRAAREVLRAAIAQVTSGAGVAASQVELVAAPSDDVECDQILLGQAISNLVQNALIASGRRSPVRVEATLEPRARPEMLRIAIDDDGDGVPIDARPRLFTPFFTTRATGTGLGLALVKRIAEAHGGSVAYEPPAERGASFVLRVPLRELARASPRLPASPEV